MFDLLLTATRETLYMVLGACFIATVIGLPLGIALVLFAPGGLVAQRFTYRVLSLFVNIMRSIPFIILLVAITPLTQLLIGTTIGTTAAIVPLALGAMPFIARIVESALHEVPRDLIKTGLVMGATPGQIVWKILLPESLPSIVDGIILVMITLVGYSAMAGAIGGGGLGEVGINYGYERFNNKVMLATVVILLIMVQAMQMCGDYFSKKLRHQYRGRVKTGHVVTLLIVSLFLVLTPFHSVTGSKRHVLRIGVMAGPESQLMETAQVVAQERYHLALKIIQFTNYRMPNAALANGDIDANMFQHLPYLQTEMKHRHYKLSVVGKSFLYPMAIYSRKISRLSELQPKSLVTLPNDPSNEMRALLLLQRAKLITVAKHSGVSAGLAQIIANPYQLRFKELAANQLPRTLNNATLAVINTNYATPAGLSLRHDSLLVENTHSPYANIVVALTKHQHDPRLATLMRVLHSTPVQKAARKLFKDGAIPAW